MWKLIIILFLLFLPPLYFNLEKSSWVEPDSIGFFSKACGKELSIKIPIISEKIFKLLGCSENNWKIFQFFYWITMFSIIGFFLKRFYGLSEYYSLILGISFYLINFIMAIEDDQIAFPLIFILGLYFLSRKKADDKYYLFLFFFGAIISSFFWKGSIIPLTIIGLSNFIIPVIILPVFLFFNKNISGQGFAIEEKVSYGFLNNNLPFFILLLFTLKGFFKIEKKHLYSLIGLLLLGFLYPKMGVYTLIPLLPVLANEIEIRQKKWKKVLIIAGALCLMVVSSLYITFNEPSEELYLLVDKGVNIQSNGGLLYNEWWSGYWISYRGGVPSHYGGYPEHFTLPDNNFYWIGSEIENCDTIDFYRSVFLQKC